MEKNLNDEGLTTNVGKTKAFDTGQRTIFTSRIDPCVMCGKKVGGNPIECVEGCK